MKLACNLEKNKWIKTGLQSVWGKGLSAEKNVTLAFTLDTERESLLQIDLTASACYKLFVDGKFVSFGPNRTAHGYARVSTITSFGRFVTVEVHSSQVYNFCWIKRAPFFACFVKTEDGRAYHTMDFACYRLHDRVQRVQRYSFQRGFAEVYSVKEDRSSLYTGGATEFERVETEKAELPKLLPSETGVPKMQRHCAQATVETGVVTVDGQVDCWRHRSLTMVGGVLEGYKIEELETIVTDDASQFVFHRHKTTKSGKKYRILDFSRAITGFFECTIEAKAAGDVYITYDEVLSDYGNGKWVNFHRNGTASVFRIRVERAGKYTVSTFEPYTARYACVVSDEGIEADFAIYDYENPDVERFSFVCEDEGAKKIVEASVATLAQNAVDLLMDCPSRERAGWLSDSYFSSVAERVFTGENKVERAFLENYLYAYKGDHPKGMIPRCYPADYYEKDGFIPNWAMWYILEIEKYAKIYGKDEIVQRSEENVRGVLEYFREQENEWELLEDLRGWIFVEWSSANDDSHVKGVNVPSNICYAACLKAAGETYGVAEYVEKAERIKSAIKRLAFDGIFFVDNLVRNVEGELMRTSNYTEVCQYYAFWFNCATPKEYPALLEELMLRLGNKRKDGYLPQLGKPNMMYGIYMRLDLLMRLGQRETLFKECVRYFLPMAEKTGTLWEHNGEQASCDHGFASYAVKWIVYALTGYDVLHPEKGVAKKGIGIDCRLCLPQGNHQSVTITVENDCVEIKA